MKLRTAAAITIFVSVLFSSSRGVAQTVQTADDSKVTRFEAASIKVNRTGHASGEAISRMGIRPDGSYRAENIDVGGLLQLAYGYSNERVIGVPKWADDERFDITAKAPMSSSRPRAPIPQQFALMMQSLLADRFKLIAHTDMREGAAYELRIARADGRLGAGLLSTDRADCDAIESGRTDIPPTPTDRPHPPCGGSLSLGAFTAGGMPMERLASGMLTRMLGRPVIDRTGLHGRFDIELTFAFGEMPRSMPFTAVGDAVPDEANRPTFFTAMQEQLGLKLQSVRAPVDVLVIDHIERPDPD